MQFTFIIKDSKYSIYKKIAASLLLLNALLFLFSGMQSNSFSKKNILIGAAVLLAAYAVYFWRYKQKKEKSFTIAYLFAALVWMALTPSWYFALFYVVLLIVQLRIETEPSISVSEEKIEIQGFSSSSYNWTGLSNAILNGGLLTLDFKNNKILQVEPDWQLTVMNKEYADLEKEFNDFCRQQLTK